MAEARRKLNGAFQHSRPGEHSAYGYRPHTNSAAGPRPPCRRRGTRRAPRIPRVVAQAPDVRALATVSPMDLKADESADARPGAIEPLDTLLARPLTEMTVDELMALNAELEARGIRIYNSVPWEVIGPLMAATGIYSKTFLETLAKHNADALIEAVTTRILKNGETIASACRHQDGMRPTSSSRADCPTKPGSRCSTWTSPPKRYAARPCGGTAASWPGEPRNRPRAPGITQSDIGDDRSRLPLPAARRGDSAPDA